MLSKWSKLKSDAIALRKKGQSLSSIHLKLGIPKSTLSYWFKNIKLSKKQKSKLNKNWRNGLVMARKVATKWHNAQKTIRLQQAEQDAQAVLSTIDIQNKGILELTLSLLYLGEGTKKKDETSLGSSNPKILNFYIKALILLYGIDTNNFRCQLYLRADQDPKKIKHYWSKTLKLPITCFGFVSLDKRTLGQETYADYKGVCSVAGGGVAVQRRLAFLADQYLDTIAQQ